MYVPKRSKTKRFIRANHSKEYTATTLYNFLCYAVHTNALKKDNSSLRINNLEQTKNFALTTMLNGQSVTLQHPCLRSWHTFKLPHLVFLNRHTHTHAHLACCSTFTALGMLVMLTQRAMPLPDTPHPTLLSLFPLYLHSTSGDNQMPCILLLPIISFSCLFFFKWVLF